MTYSLLEHTFCNTQEEIIGSYRNYSGPHYDVNCWKNSTTFNNRSYQVSFQCETRCISKYRVRDGIRDCRFSEENYHINNSCPQIQRHRLQCSSSELSCLLAGALGNLDNDCSNKRDEIDYESRKLLFQNIRCQGHDDPECVYLQNYIRMSSYKDVEDTVFSNRFLPSDHSTSAIQFPSYCNSFFDLEAGFDELPELCREWSCTLDEYQCLSGQCIWLDWICDGIYVLLSSILRN